MAISDQMIYLERTQLVQERSTDSLCSERCKTITFMILSILVGLALGLLVASQVTPVGSSGFYGIIAAGGVTGGLIACLVKLILNQSCDKNRKITPPVPVSIEKDLVIESVPSLPKQEGPDDLILRQKVNDIFKESSKRVMEKNGLVDKHESLYSNSMDKEFYELLADEAIRQKVTGFKFDLVLIVTAKGGHVNFFNADGSHGSTHFKNAVCKQDQDLSKFLLIILCQDEAALNYWNNQKIPEIVIESHSINYRGQLLAMKGPWLLGYQYEPILQKIIESTKTSS